MEKVWTLEKDDNLDNYISDAIMEVIRHQSNVGSIVLVQGNQKLKITKEGVIEAVKNHNKPKPTLTVEDDRVEKLRANKTLVDPREYYLNG